MVCVRCTDVAPPPAAARGESAPPRPALVAGRAARTREPGAGGRPRDDLRRSARLHPQPSRPGARHQPLHPPPPPSLPRDDRDALGREADSRRRAGAARRRAAATRASARPAGAGWSARRAASRARPPDPRRARRGQELRPDRPRAQREPGTDGARRRPVVAFNRALGLAAEDAGRRSATVFVMSESLRVTIVYEQGDEGRIVASIPEVPGANSQGRTREEARANVIEALRGILELRFGGHPEVTEGADSEPLELVIGARSGATSSAISEVTA